MHCCVKIHAVFKLDFTLAGLKRATPENFRQKTGWAGPKKQWAQLGRAVMLGPCRDLISERHILHQLTGNQAHQELA